jgi:hypothetical protein
VDRSKRLEATGRLSLPAGLDVERVTPAKPGVHSRLIIIHPHFMGITLHLDGRRVSLVETLLFPAPKGWIVARIMKNVAGLWLNVVGNDRHSLFYNYL